MTPEQLQAAKDNLARANALLRVIELCDKYDPQTGSLASRLGLDEDDFATFIVVAGLKALREGSEAELEKLEGCT